MELEAMQAFGHLREEMATAEERMVKGMDGFVAQVRFEFSQRPDLAYVR